MTKELDGTWVAGTNQGGLDTGVKAADTTYHCFAIYNPTTGADDGLFSASLASPAMPSGFTKKKRVGSIITNATGNIINGTFYYKSDGSYRFDFKDFIQDFDGTATNVATSATITTPVGISCNARIVVTSATGSQSVYFYSPNDNDPASISNNFDVSPRNVTNESTGTEINIITNNSSEIKYLASGSRSIAIYTLGFEDFNLN